MVPSGDVVFVEASWDVLLRCAYCMLQYAVYVASASTACGFGRTGILLSVSAVNNSQLAFRKFHLLTGLPAIGCTSDGTLMIDGRWCDRGNLPLMRRSGFGSQLRPTANDRSGWYMCSIVQRRSSGAPLGHTVALRRHWMPSRSASHRTL